MAAPPVELFALRIEPGQTVPVDTERDVVITNVCFASEEALKPGQTTILKVHHVKVDQDSDDDEDDDEQDDEDDDEDEELPDASASSGKAKTPAKKAATEGGPNKKQDEEDSDEEEDNDDDLDGVVEQEYSLARLTTGQVRHCHPCPCILLLSPPFLGQGVCYTRGSVLTRVSVVFLFIFFHGSYNLICPLFETMARRSK